MVPNFLKIRSESSELPLAAEQNLFFNRRNRRTGTLQNHTKLAFCAVDLWRDFQCHIPARHRNDAVRQPSGWLSQWTYALVIGSAGVLHMRRTNDIR